MHSETKIQLSKLETKLIQNKEWILTKRDIINKVYLLFGQMQEHYKKILMQEKHSAIMILSNAAGKISKGDNYKGLPYVMLDYPASFTKENIFAIRTMFWWGNFFSISLHLSGKKFQLRRNVLKLFSLLKQEEFFICINDNEWEHNFALTNYVCASGITESDFRKILKRNFFKISKKIELNKWQSAPEFLEKTFRDIIKVIRISFPTGEKDLLPGFPKAGSGL